MDVSNTAFVCVHASSGAPLSSIAPQLSWPDPNHLPQHTNYTLWQGCGRCEDVRGAAGQPWRGMLVCPMDFAAGAGISCVGLHAMVDVASGRIVTAFSEPAGNYE